jgi:hypothetical protein
MVDCSFTQTARVPQSCSRMQLRTGSPSAVQICGSIGPSSARTMSPAVIADGSRAST